MNFNTLAFLLFFPTVTALHYILPHRFRWALLLAASWLFYGLGSPAALGLLLLATAVSWLCALGMGRGPWVRRLLLGLALAVCLGSLCFFKYGTFLAELAGLSPAEKILLPAGISFYTFQTLSYVLDVYRGRVKAERHLGYYALFVSFFPQLVAGPIERPENLLPQLRAERPFSRENLRAGGWLLLTGYFQKVAVADSLAPFVDRVYGGEGGGPAVLLATFLFGFQIYCDFAGYSNIARGAAKLLGIDLTENFRRPFEATTVRDFWRRWHISLTSWFTDYVYIPLGGSRKGLARRLMNLMIVFLLSGLWHGAGWNFLIWGAVHGLYQVVGVLWDRFGPKTVKCPPLFRRLRTYLLVSLPWLLFRAGSLPAAGALLARLGGGWNVWPLDLPALLLLTAPLLCIPALEDLPQLGREAVPERAALVGFTGILAVGLAWLAGLAAGGENAFIYFQF